MPAKWLMKDDGIGVPTLVHPKSCGVMVYVRTGAAPRRRSAHRKWCICGLVCT